MIASPLARRIVLSTTAPSQVTSLHSAVLTPIRSLHTLTRSAVTAAQNPQHFSPPSYASSSSSSSLIAATSTHSNIVAPCMSLSGWNSASSFVSTKNSFMKNRRFFSFSASTSTASSSHPLPKILRTISDVRSLRNSLLKSNRTLGFVPTMGALHSGHVSLAARSMQENDVTVVSIFVNPTQFGPNEDLDAYPRTLENDMRLLSEIGVQYVFVPEVKEMYGENAVASAKKNGTGIQMLTEVHVPSVATTAESLRRPGHFTGVATVVTKLLNIVQPSHAYFGQKDGIQCIVIRRIVEDLNIPTQVMICPTERAKEDGLALSSRNVYLTTQERSVAGVLFRALSAANDAYLSPQKERNTGKLRKLTKEILENEKSGVLEYVSIANGETGAEYSDTDSLPEVSAGAKTMLSIAYKLGKPRLIDNCILGQELKKGK